MYEAITFEILLTRMINRAIDWAVAHNTVIDTREGSLIYSALAPAAAELKQADIELDNVLDESFADTQSRAFLIREAAERGVHVMLATKAIRRGEFNMDVPIGSRFSLNLLNYIVIERISLGVFKLECETPGNVGNLESGRLIPITFISGLTSAMLTDVLTPGEDDETTEHLRRRYFDSIDAQEFGGNIADYRTKVGNLPGVGGVKVYPVWAGGGTVKVVFTTSLYQPPLPALIADVQEAIDPLAFPGVGLGLAPIGHVVTVQGVTAKIINMQFSLVFQPGYTWAIIQTDAQEAIDQYLLELAEAWDTVDWQHDPTATLVVRVSQVETRLLDVQGVLDISGTLLNGLTSNIILDVNAVPVRGTITNV